MNQEPRITRRNFVSRVAAGAFGISIVPRHVLGGPGYLPPSDRLHIAMIGAGGMGAENALNLVIGGQNIVALADVDFPHVDRTVAGKLRDGEGRARPEGEKLRDMYAAAKRYHDYREMLDRERENIDAVLIATPDHSHAPAASLAMRRGKHVYVQKPLTWSVHEARALNRLARSTGVVTQMGNQGHTISADARRVNEWVQAGVLGPVREVHVWTNRPVWPQGVPRPAEVVGRPTGAGWNEQGLRATLAGAMGGTYPVPGHLHWDLFLGPAPEVEYHPIYHPFNWRGWLDWGVGALGDMGAHLIDHPYWALGLDYPSAIEATSTPWGPDARGRPASYPQAMTVHYEFPARAEQPAVRMSWYDGGLLPPRPPRMPRDVKMNWDPNGGAYYVGERGVLLHGMWGSKPQLFPQSLMSEAEQVPQRYPRFETSHEMNWVNAIRGEAEATSPFSYAAPLTEVMLLGLVALRAGQGVRIGYDGRTGRTDSAEADRFLHREYRRGWEL